MALISQIEFEPLVAEEQGVVYLFAKYKEKLGPFLSKIEILKAGTRFPDFIYKKGNELNGIEFEGKLSGIEEHYTQFKNFYFDIMENYGKEPGKKKTVPFLVIYWTEDRDKKQVENIIRRKLKAAGMKPTVKLINLSEFFQPISLKRKHIFTRLRINSSQKLGEAYNFQQIKKKYLSLKAKGEVEETQKEEDAIRLMGYNAKRAGDLPLSAWKNIHIFTTSSVISTKYNFKYFVMINNEGTLILKIHTVFRHKKGKKRIESFFKNHYFFDQLGVWDFKNSNPTLVIYNKAKFFPVSSKNKVGMKLLELWGKDFGQQSGGTITKKEQPREFSKALNLLKKVCR